MRTLPSSFSRFVSEEDLNRVRDEFLSALADLEAEEFGEGDGEPGEGAESEHSPQTDARTAESR